MWYMEQSSASVSYIANTYIARGNSLYISLRNLGFFQIRSVWVDTSRNLMYAPDFSGNIVRRITLSSNPVVTTIAGTGRFDIIIVHNSLFICSSYYALCHSGIAGSAGENVAATSARLHNPYAVVGDSIGNLFISSSESHTIRVMNVSSSKIKTYAGVAGCNVYSGSSSPATNACMVSPAGIVVDTFSNLYLADYGNNRCDNICEYGNDYFERLDIVFDLFIVPFIGYGKLLTLRRLSTIMPAMEPAVVLITPSRLRAVSIDRMHCSWTPRVGCTSRNLFPMS
jgi:hypothetical protein